MVCSLASNKFGFFNSFCRSLSQSSFFYFRTTPFKTPKNIVSSSSKKKKRLQLTCQQELPTLLYKKPRRGERINRVMRPDTKTSCPQAGRMNLQSPQYFCHIIASFPPTSILFLFSIKIS